MRGLPVAVAALTHYRECGFTIDVGSHEELERALDAARAPSAEAGGARPPLRVHLLLPLHDPVPVRADEEGFATAVPSDAERIRPGADPYLDFVCDRILDGGEFVLPDALAV